MTGAPYRLSPFQQWLALLSESNSANSESVAELILPIDARTARQVADKIRDACWLSRAAVVADPQLGIVLVLTDSPEAADSAKGGGRVLAAGLRIEVTAQDALRSRMTLHVPRLLGDSRSLRLLQEAAVATVRGKEPPVLPPDVPLRYAEWQSAMPRVTEPAESGPAEEQPTMRIGRRDPGVGAMTWRRIRFGRQVAQAVHRTARLLDISAQAVVTGWWRALTDMLGLATPLWIEVDGRHGPVPSYAVGQLSAYRRWALGRTTDRALHEVLRQSDAWLTEAASRQPAWVDAHAPDQAPLLACTLVPGREHLVVPGGHGEMLAPVPAPLARALHLAVAVGADDIEVGAWYDPRRHQPADLDEMLRTFGRILAHLPNRRWTAASWRGQALGSPGAALEGRRTPAGGSLWERIRLRAAERADAPAVGGADGRLSYGELVARASAVAYRLRQAGVRPGDRIGLLVDESPELVVAMLGCYALGAAYVPMHTDLPPDRVAAMVEAADVRLTIVSAGREVRLPQRARALRVEEASLPATGAPPAVDGDHAGLAYVLFTSGSTGAPKGVMVSRRGLENYLDWAARSYPLTEGAGVVSHTAPIFDLSVTSLLAPLLAGQYVHVVPSGAGLDGIRAALRQVRDVTLLKLTPSQLSLLHHAPDLIPTDDEPLRVRALVVGGEDLPAGLVTHWADRHPGCQVFNEYGPTETVVGCTAWQADGGEAELATVPIGHPIQNTQVHVLDTDLTPVVSGVPGELYVAGDGVAWGYLGDARSTARNFLPNPWGPPGSVMYRSGDLVTRLASCGLRYEGRRDRQLKLHGYRIEPGEVEGCLRDLTGVTDAVVRMAALPSGATTLVGYVVTADGAELDPTAVRTALARRLPAFMLPGIVHTLPALPLGPSGKLDERRLPVPRPRRASPAEALTPSQRLVSDAWATVLGIPPPGLDERFFEVGGASYTLVKVNALLREAFGRDIKIADMFEHATVRDLAAFLDGGSPAPETTGPEDGTDRLAAMRRLQLRRRSSDG